MRAFSSARAFDPGMNNRLRRGRIMAGFPEVFSSPTPNISACGSKALFLSSVYG
jgi:hypothetical protein